jgi:hypothetical protein
MELHKTINTWKLNKGLLAEKMQIGATHSGNYIEWCYLKPSENYEYDDNSKAVWRNTPMDMCRLHPAKIRENKINSILG